VARRSGSRFLIVPAAALTVALGAVLAAQTPPPAAPKKRLEPMKGTAVIQMLKPVVKVVGKDVVTTLKIKNASYGPVAGLRVDEYWYDAGGNFMPGDFKRIQRVEPAEIVTIELRTPKSPKMKSNSYQFSHINGKCKVEVVPKL